MTRFPCRDRVRVPAGTGRRPGRFRAALRPEGWRIRLRRAIRSARIFFSARATAVLSHIGPAQRVRNVGGVVMFPVTAEAEERADDHLRPVTGAGALDGGLENFEAGGEVGAVDGVAFHAIAAGAVDQIRAGELAAGGGGVGKLIVRDGDDQREVFPRRPCSGPREMRRWRWRRRRSRRRPPSPSSRPCRRRASNMPATTLMVVPRCEIMAGMPSLGRPWWMFPSRPRMGPRAEPR